MSTQPLPDVVRDFERVSADIVKQASQFQAAILADVAGPSRNAQRPHSGARSLDANRRDRRLPVEVRPGDNLMIHAAMALAKPGDVIVVDGKGDQTCALMGAIMINQCKALGVVRGDPGRGSA
jgi:hypothetical protein